jgi:DNA-binding transcriptional MerR regulator/effector-binding domain-containing protein
VADVNEGLMAIGLFSRASLLSVKALRAYHEAGILVPARVDPATGYRSYHAGQLTDAAVIRRLRDLDLPLDRVREVVAARDPEVTRRVLADHAAAMQARLADVTRIVGELQDGLDRPAEHTPVHVRDEPGTHTLAVRGSIPESGFAAFLGGAYAALGEVAERAGLAPSGPAGALYPPEIPDDAAQPVEAYLPVGTPGPLPADRGPVVLGEVPAARVAVLGHGGPYETLADAYRRLGAWVAHNARPAPGPVREVYVVSYGDTDDPARFRTEIHWPVLEEAPA